MDRKAIVPSSLNSPREATGAALNSLTERARAATRRHRHSRVITQLTGRLRRFG